MKTLLFLLASALLVASCTDTVDTANSPEPLPAGKGRFTLTFQSTPATIFENVLKVDRVFQLAYPGATFGDYAGNLDEVVPVRSNTPRPYVVDNGVMYRVYWLWKPAEADTFRTTAQIITAYAGMDTTITLPTW